MKKYARVIDGVVFETFETNGDISDYFPPEFGFTECAQKVQQGWLVSGDGYEPPKRHAEPTRQDFLESAKASLRTMRAPMLDALTGIAGRAARAGNDALAAEADALAEQLLDITDDATLKATTYEAMQAAGVAAYRRIASGASPELASVFKEITGV